jgi:restriction endonuclease S subunit
MTHVETFKTSVVRIRDLLRSQGITGMDSMRHICLYLMSRYMTKERVGALGIPDEFSWNALMTLMQKGDTVSATDVHHDKDEYALNHFYNTETKCVVRHIDSLFGTEKFPFDVKCHIRHKETMKILSTVELDEVDVHMDVLGWVYEQHLKTGSSAARDLGQFFTDRSICTYMTELCCPGFKYPGVPESMCDPAMGTGGFQAAYMKYYKRYQETPDHVDWKIQHTEIHGCDTDQKVAGLARLNLFIESGGALFTHLKHQDSLNKGLPQTGYDVILANMPFGLKGLKYKDCCDRVKALKIDGTKSEPLFLQLMMVSLNAGGRCAVVVPDGMLVNTSACHNGTRKYLLDHFELKRVIKMRGQFFMNTGIQPSILFFENTGKPTASVEFWDVVADGKAMTETMVLSVPRVAMDDACVLDVRRYQEVKEVANSAGFPMVKLGDVCDLLGGKGNYTQDGDTYPYYDSNGITGTRKDYLYDGEYVVTARKMSIGAVHYVSGKYWASDNTINLCVKPESELSGRFLYYWLLLNNRVLKDLSSGIKPGIRKSDVAEINMPLPPLAIQHEIVATLDRIYQPGTTELADTLKLTNQAMDLVLAQPSGATLEPIVEAQRLMRKSAQMVADVKAQMVAIVKSVGCRGFEMKKLDDVCDFVSGKGNYTQDGNAYPYYDSNGITGTRKDYLHDGEYIITARKMSIGAVHYATGKFWASDNTINMTSNDTTKLNNRFLYYWLLMNNDILKAMSSGIKPGIRKSDVIEIKMPLPPLAFQQAVLNRLDALQSQLTSLENLGKQAEDNARFILESYLNTDAPQTESASAAVESGNASEVESAIAEDDEKEEPRIAIPIRRPRSVSPARSAPIPDYASMSVAALKELVKARGLRGLSGKKKEELVVILRDLS